MKALLNAIELRPKTCVWEITFACNLKCLHCASDVNNNWSRGSELTIEEATTVIRDLKALGCEQVVLSGGEALLRKDWDIIAHKILDQGMKVSLVSNGMCIDDKQARHISAVGVNVVALSIDGDEPIHNYIRQNPSAHGRAIRAASSLAAEKVPFNVITTITKLNMPLLPKIEDTVASIGAFSWFLQIGAQVGRMCRHPELIISPGDLPSIAGAIIAAKKRKRVRVDVSDTIGYYSDKEKKLRGSNDDEGFKFFFGCAAGCLGVGIESNGNVKGCLSLQSDRFIEGNIRRESLIDIWRKKGNFSYTRNFKVADLKGSCRRCEYGELCRGGCSFTAFGGSGSVHDNPYCLYAVTKKGMDTSREPTS